jgi:ESCRT-II complex subunit
VRPLSPFLFFLALVGADDDNDGECWGRVGTGAGVRLRRGHKTHRPTPPSSFPFLLVFQILFPGRLMSDYLTRIIGIMVSKNLAVYEPAKQTRAVLLYWRLPEEWAEVLHEWVRDSSLPPFSLSIASLLSRPMWLTHNTPCCRRQVRDS